MPRYGTVAAAAVAAALLVSPAVAVDLTHGSWPPAGDHLNTTALPNAFKRIDEQTNGAVKWKLVAGGQLADGKGTFQAVQDNVIQGGLGIAVYVPNLVPSLSTIYSTIVFGDDVVAATGAAMETLLLNCPSCIEEFQKINAVPLGGFTGSPYYLSCREPLRSAADLKGKRVRATGGAVELFNQAGAVPISATLTEAVTLLQRGGMDCMFGVWEWLKTYSYGDVTKHVTDYPLGITGPALGLMLNREAFKKLTPDQQKIHLRQAGYVTGEMALGNFVIKNEQSLKEVMSTRNVAMVKADTVSFDELTKKYKEVERSRIVDTAKKFGVKDPESILAAYERNLEKWKPLSKEIGRDITKFAETVTREVYDKVDPNKL